MKKEQRWGDLKDGLSRLTVVQRSSSGPQCRMLAGIAQIHLLWGKWGN